MRPEEIVEVSESHPGGLDEAAQGVDLAQLVRRAHDGVRVAPRRASLARF